MRMKYDKFGLKAELEALVPGDDRSFIRRDLSQSGGVETIQVRKQQDGRFHVEIFVNSDCFEQDDIGIWQVLDRIENALRYQDADFGRASPAEIAAWIFKPGYFSPKPS